MSYGQVSPQLADDQIRKVIYYCSHCGEDMGGAKRALCDGCSTKSKREEMDKNNKEINPSFVCRYCLFN